MSDLAPVQSPVLELGAVTRLEKIIERGQGWAARPDFPPGFAKWFGAQVRTELRKLYGSESQAVKLWPLIEGTLTRDEARTLTRDHIARASQLLQLLKEAVAKALAPERGHRVFIGHGRSPVWRELKDLLEDRLSLSVEEFNRQPVAGVATTERLQQMLDISTFAFLIMTAEDEHADSKQHARANVIHEVGLFQGRLGNRRAIILLEGGCEQFSNIHGLSHIPFPRNDVSAAFEKIRMVLEREGIIRT